MNDADLMFAENQRPAVIPGGVWGVATFPELGAPKYLDFREVLDWARGTPIYANFRIETPFNSIAENQLRFAVFVSNDPTFIDLLSDSSLILATSLPITGAGLAAAGKPTVTVALPPLNDYAADAAQGRRYLSLGFEYYVPTTDWSAGGVTAWLSPRPLPPKPLSVRSGF
jgi:hypothetical protein